MFFRQNTLPGLDASQVKARIMRSLDRVPFVEAQYRDGEPWQAKPAHWARDSGYQGSLKGLAGQDVFDRYRIPQSNTVENQRFMIEPGRYLNDLFVDALEDVYTTPAPTATPPPSATTPPASTTNFGMAQTLYARYRAGFYLTPEPLTPSGVTPREKGEIVGMYLGQKQYSATLRTWLIQVRVPVLDALTSTTYVNLWVDENDVAPGRDSVGAVPPGVPGSPTPPAAPDPAPAPSTGGGTGSIFQNIANAVMEATQTAPTVSNPPPTSASSGGTTTGGGTAPSVLNAGGQPQNLTNSPGQAAAPWTWANVPTWQKWAGGVVAALLVLVLLRGIFNR